MSAGDICSACGIGKIYPSTPRISLQFKGNPPLECTRHIKLNLRCNACQIEFQAKGQANKWDYTAKTAIVLLKTMGMPWYRLANLQLLYNIPVAASTLWLQCKGLFEDVGSYIISELFKQAAECNTYYVDDTPAKILEVIKANKKLPLDQAKRSCRTTVIATTTPQKHDIVLYLTGDAHCGENLGKLLERKSNQRSHIRIMSDASTMNKPVTNDLILNRVIHINCLTHGRAKFADIESFYQEQCGYFLAEIKSIYQNEDLIKEHKLSSKKRLLYHLKHSLPHLNNIYQKINDLLQNKLVEPNSSLGKAMNYWVRNKKGLTMFTRVRNVALDNNLSERLLKYMILQRKNSLFFATKDSAVVLSGLTSLVETCRANQINASSYLNWIQENERDVQKNPANYLPWKFKEVMDNMKLASAA
ncbi:MAG: hypothetical protein RI982_1363 [Bacteroidota bacterium]